LISSKAENFRGLLQKDFLFIRDYNQLNYELIAAAALSAFLGAYIGNRLVKKIKIKTLHYIVAVMLFVFALLLGLGII
jgi:uncharacterized membrane protein YfcA